MTPFWRFLPVEGVSELPVGHQEDGTNVTSMLPVTMPKFWIAERMVTEWDFARLMGREVRKGREGVDEHCSPPVTDIEWEDALEYCDRFTKKFADQLPAGFYATLPQMKSPMAGLRPVLVSRDGGVALTGTNVIGNTNMARE